MEVLYHKRPLNYWFILILQSRSVAGRKLYDQQTMLTHIITHLWKHEKTFTGKKGFIDYTCDKRDNGILRAGVWSFGLRMWNVEVSHEKVYDDQ